MQIYMRSGKLPRLVTRNLVLREIGQGDITSEYISWLNNPDVNRFLEIRFEKQTPERVAQYVQQHLDDIESFKHFGVYIPESGRDLLVGTVTLTRINKWHETSDISFVIGHPMGQRKGYGTESVHAVCAYAFMVEKFHRLYAGHYRQNIASQSVLLKNNFKQEGVLREYCLSDGKRTDCITYGLLNREYRLNPALLGDQGEVTIIEE